MVKKMRRNFWKKHFRRNLTFQNRLCFPEIQIVINRLKEFRNYQKTSSGLFGLQTSGFHYHQKRFDFERFGYLEKMAEKNLISV
jgi:hypothetical protein